MATNGVAVVIPAKDEADRIGTTARVAAEVPGVDLVVVVDDGSSDDTGEVAGKAGALVVRHDRNAGKGAAMVSGAEAVHLLDGRDGRDRPRHLLFLDADLGETAGWAGPLVEPVRDGAADATVAVMPGAGEGGGFGLVVELSREGIRRATGWAPAQPLNGQRCLTRDAFEAARPLAYGFGVETGMTIDLHRKGFRVREVEVPFAHRVTGRDLPAQLHRARQLAHVARALLARGVPPSTLLSVRGRLPGRRLPGARRPQ